MCCGSERGIPKAGALVSQVLKPNEPSQSQGLPGLLPVSCFWPFFPRVSFFWILFICYGLHLTVPQRLKWRSGHKGVTMLQGAGSALRKLCDWSPSLPSASEALPGQVNSCFHIILPWQNVLSQSNRANRLQTETSQISHQSESFLVLMGTGYSNWGGSSG